MDGADIAMRIDGDVGYSGYDVCVVPQVPTSLLVPPGAWIGDPRCFPAVASARTKSICVIVSEFPTPKL